MPRRYRRRKYYPVRSLKTAKYSNETEATAVSSTFLSSKTYKCTFTPGTTVLGTRKVKNFTLSIISNSNISFYFALVFVPEGTIASDINFGYQIDESGILTAASLYEPNQNVIISGIFGGPSGSVQRFKSRLARNLNSNDTIQLVMRPISNISEARIIQASLNYALAY